MVLSQQRPPKAYSTPTFEVIHAGPSHAAAWDAYVSTHPEANVYHLFAWRNVLTDTYGLDAYYLAAVSRDSKNIVGVLPLFHLKHFLFGNALISIPYFDMAGVVADSEQISAALIQEAVRIGRRLKTNSVEIRSTEPLPSLSDESTPTHPKRNSRLSDKGCFVTASSHKVRMLLPLSDTSGKLMKSFKSKLRSQVLKPGKEGLTAQVGGIELLDAFYSVFTVNMRDLGSPVHSKMLFKNVFKAFGGRARIVIAGKDKVPYAGSIIVGFRDTLENPWASALRQYSQLSPNMLLYWQMLAYACDNGYRLFDFGRSTPDEGTYRFKKQWGAEESALYWYYMHNRPQPSEGPGSEKSRFQKAIGIWQKLPVPVTRVIGPKIRKHIGL